MRTSATRIGRTVPREFEGTVRAVWRRAVAVAPEIAGLREFGVRLVTLVREGVPMTAASIALRVGDSFDFTAWGVSAGDRVHCDSMTLSLSTADPRRSIVIDLRGAVPYDGQVTAHNAGVDLASLGVLEAAARRRREAMCGRQALGLAAMEACDAHLERLFRGAVESDALAATHAARALVGLGPGLTPAGDDALCGFMLGRRLAGARASAVDEAVKDVASRAAGLTSDVSVVQLELAARERFGEALLGAGMALTRGREACVDSAVARCLAQGATSGADALLGMAVGLRASAHTGLRLDVVEAAEA